MEVDSYRLLQWCSKEDISYQCYVASDSKIVFVNNELKMMKKEALMA